MCRNSLIEFLTCDMVWGPVFHILLWVQDHTFSIAIARQREWLVH